LGKEFSFFDVRIIVAAHTDNVPVSTPQFPSNYHLSLERAMNVTEIFYEQIDGRMISTLGFGEYDPITENETPGGRQRNRRLEIIVLPKSIPGVLRLIDPVIFAVYDFYSNNLAEIISTKGTPDSELNFNAFTVEFMLLYGREIYYPNVTLTDSDGIVLFRSNLPSFFGDSIAYLPDIEAALRGDYFSGYIEGVLGETAVAAIPVFDNNGSVVGALRLSLIG